MKILFEKICNIYHLTREAIVKEKISVIVLTYNPSKQKLIATLKSIIRQENVDVQVIISDDGSKENYFEEAKEFLEKNSFTDYKFVSCEKNQGTVKNVIRAVHVSNGEYVKLISPGDMFTSNNILSGWFNHLIQSKYKWSICEAIYYKNINGCISPIKQPTHPMITDVYEKQQERKCRWNYVILDDIALGAATICERNLLMEYLFRINDKVVYAEDNIYRIMMFDGICADYFSGCAIFYEYGEGVSAPGESVWGERLVKDWSAADLEMLRKLDINDPLQVKMTKILKNNKTGNKYIRDVRKIMEPGRLKIALLRKYKMRYSLTEFPEDINAVNWYGDN